MGSPKWERLLERLKQNVSSIIINDLQDPRLGFMTITKVELSKDKQFLKIFVSVFGDEGQKKTTIKGLISSRGYIQTEINKRMRLRHTPILRFHLDESVETSIEVCQLIKQARESDPDKGIDVNAEPDEPEQDNESDNSVDE